jgi:hypothetical protein
MKNRPSPPCSRCGFNSGGNRWIAASNATKNLMPEIALCDDCVSALRSFFANAKLSPATNRKQPDRFASPSPPPPKPSAADEMPVRWSRKLV